MLSDAAVANGRGVALWHNMRAVELWHDRRGTAKAYAQDPGNAIIANNLKLLDGSERIIRRDPSTF
jgi:hypothetical protein